MVSAERSAGLHYPNEKKQNSLIEKQRFSLAHVFIEGGRS